MWFNMVRYAEIQTKIGRQGTITLFVKYNKKKKRVSTSERPKDSYLYKDVVDEIIIIFSVE